MVEQLRRTYTRDDIIRGGACADEVDKWCKKKGLYVCDIDTAIELSSNTQKEYILRSTIRDGYGSGSGSGYGYGSGSGYGYGDGYGDGSGDGYGYGSGYGDGYGSCYGSCDGYGSGSGSGYGYGDGDGYGYGELNSN